MQYRVEMSTQAKRDLNRIYDFIEAEISHQAMAWFEGLHTALLSLSNMPQRSPIIREDLSTRHLLYGKKPHVYRAIYFVNEAAFSVTILSIRHGARGPFRPNRT